MKQALSTVWIINVDVIFTLTIRFIELGYLYLSIAIKGIGIVRAKYREIKELFTKKRVLNLSIIY